MTARARAPRKATPPRRLYEPAPSSPDRVIKWQTRSSCRAFPFHHRRHAFLLGPVTTGERRFAMCPTMCRVSRAHGKKEVRRVHKIKTRQSGRHTAHLNITVCHMRGHTAKRARRRRLLYYSRRQRFVVCKLANTRQNFHLCRVPTRSTRQRGHVTLT